MPAPEPDCDAPTRSALTAPGRRIAGTVRLVHPYPVMTVLATSALLMAVASGGLPPAGRFIRAMLVVLLSQIAVGALNDYHDRHSDARTQPDKPIPSGLVPAWAALALAVGAGLLFVPAALGSGPIAFVVAFAGLCSGFAYDLWLKPGAFSVLGYIGGFLSLATWIFLVFDRVTAVFIAVYPIGSLLLVAAHLANALPDVATDRALGQRNLAVQLGARGSYRTILVLSWAVCGTGAVAAAVSHNALSGGVIVCGSVLIAVAWWSTRTDPTARDSAQRLFRVIAPAIGLLAVGCLLAVRSLN